MSTPRASRVLFRVDAGPETGLGHLQRCLSLAEAMRRTATHVVFLAPELEEVRSRVEARGFCLLSTGLDWTEPRNRLAWSWAVDAARACDCDVVVTDSYEIGDDYVRALRGSGLKVISIDDLAAHPSSAHVLVNGAAGAETLPYRSASGDTRFLLGPRYALLPETFRDLPARSVADVRRIFVAVGGSDPRGALTQVLHSVDRVRGSFDMIAVVGPFTRVDPEMMAAPCRHDIQFVNARQQLLPLMLESDLAVSAGGQILYELSAAGTPTVACRVADNQAHNIRYLVAEGVVQDGGCVGESGFIERLESTVSELLDGAKRARMSRAGQRLIDGWGAARVADAIVAPA